MDEDKNYTSEQTIGQAVVQFVEGGLPRLLLSKPVQQAIGMLVFAMVDVPVAKLQQWAQDIRNETAAKKQITNAIASKAKALAVEDKDLIDRGLERWTRQLGKRQRAREDVAVRTLMLLGESDLPPEAAAPSEEFMDLFEEIAEKASSEELADLLARILAGEIRKPKSVSRRTLQVASILDAEIVGALNAIRPYLTVANWMHIPRSKSEELRRLLDILYSTSIVNQYGPRTFAPHGHTVAVLDYGIEVLVVTCKLGLGPWMIDGVNLTPIGAELVSVLPRSTEMNMEEIGRGFKECNSFVVKVQIGATPKNGEAVDMSKLRNLE